MADCKFFFLFCFVLLLFQIICWLGPDFVARSLAFFASRLGFARGGSGCARLWWL